MNTVSQNFRELVYLTMCMTLAVVLSLSIIRGAPVTNELTETKVINTSPVSISQNAQSAL